MTVNPEGHQFQNQQEPELDMLTGYRPPEEMNYFVDHGQKKEDLSSGFGWR